MRGGYARRIEHARRMEHARRVRVPRMHAARQVRPVRARHRRAKRDRYSFDVAHIYNSDVIYKNQMLTYVDFPNFVAVMFCIDSRFQSAHFRLHADFTHVFKARGARARRGARRTCTSKPSEHPPSGTPAGLNALSRGLNGFAAVYGTIPEATGQESPQDGRHASTLRHLSQRR